MSLGQSKYRDVGAGLAHGNTIDMQERGRYKEGKIVSGKFRRKISSISMRNLRVLVILPWVLLSLTVLNIYMEYIERSVYVDMLWSFVGICGRWIKKVSSGAFRGQLGCCERRVYVSKRWRERVFLLLCDDGEVLYPLVIEWDRTTRNKDIVSVKSMGKNI